MKPTLTLLTALLLAPLAALHAAEVPSESSNRIVNAGDYGLNNIPTDRWDAKRFHENPDSTEAIQAACDAGAGRTVYIPAGLYRVTKPIRVQSGTQVMDAGFCPPGSRPRSRSRFFIFRISFRDRRSMALPSCLQTRDSHRECDPQHECRAGHDPRPMQALVNFREQRERVRQGWHRHHRRSRPLDHRQCRRLLRPLRGLQGKAAGIAIDAQSTNCDDAGNIPKPTVGAGLPEPKSGDPK